MTDFIVPDDLVLTVTIVAIVGCLIVVWLLTRGRTDAD